MKYIQALRRKSNPLLFLFLFTPVQAADKPVQIPAQIQSYLTQHFPDAILIKSMTGYFNRDGIDDYALLLQPADCDPTFYCTKLLIALSSTNPATYQIIDDIETHYCDVLDVRRPGIQEGLEPLTLTTDAIGCGRDNGSYVIIWWNGQELKQNWVRN